MKQAVRLWLLLCGVWAIVTATILFVVVVALWGEITEEPDAWLVKAGLALAWVIWFPGAVIAAFVVVVQELVRRAPISSSRRGT